MQKLKPRLSRQLIVTVIFMAAVMVCGGFLRGAQADVPVYLKRESRFPSGLHPKEWLEARTKETQVQRWFRVVTAGTYGWLPEDHVLSSLKLSSIARTVRDEPDRSAPQMDAVKKNRVPKESQVIILEILGSWARGRVLGDEIQNQDSWFLTEALKRDPGQQLVRGLVFQSSSLRAEPKSSAPVIDKLSAFKDISVISSVTRGQESWLEIQTDHASAWIERKYAWLPGDLTDGSLRSMTPGLELRSAPQPGADVVKQLTGTEILKVVETRYLRWGRVNIPEHGWLWWPITDEGSDENRVLPPLQISTQDLVHRTIYDMTVSPAVPGLRFASAKGIFKSRDGITWSMIPKFENDNYPVAISKSGVLFVGPYVSADNGETFEQWIRWDKIVETVKQTTGTPPSRLRLSGLETIDAEGRELHLILDVGRKASVKVSTADRGLSWNREL